MRTATTLLMLTVMLSSRSAFADWATVGAASRCTANAFVVEGIVESSAGSIYPSTGATKLTKPKSVLRCSVANAHVEARVFVSRPSERGECGSAGTVWVETMKINGKNILKEPGYMNNYCSTHPTYSRLEVVSNGSNLIARVCFGTWDWGTVFENQKCDEILIANPAVQGTLRDKAAQRP